MEAQTPAVDEASSTEASPQRTHEYVVELVQKARLAAGRLTSL
jgi:hypothetical protein